LGQIVLCTGPHLGVCYDGHIWKRTGAKLLLPWEWWIGDGAYISQKQFLYPHRVPPNGSLTAEQILTNTIISHYRARVEHINHLFEQHGVFRGKFRGGIALLSSAFYVIAHTTNIELRKENRTYIWSLGSYLILDLRNCIFL